jgi:hypothetical protein
MKRIPFYLMIAGALLSLVLAPACSTTEEQAIVYDLTGSWVFSCQWTGGPHFSLNFTFTGSLTNGVAVNTTDGYSGVYTVNNTAVEIVTNYAHSFCGTATETYTGTFTSPTTMSGGYMKTYSGPCIVGGELTWTAVKL